MDLLSVIWWISAIGGMIAMLVGLVWPRARFRVLWAAAAMFLIAGILGAASIGIIFLAGAGAALAAAYRSQAPTS